MRKDNDHNRSRPRARSLAMQLAKIGPAWLWLIAALAVAVALLVSASLTAAAGKPFPDLIPLPDNFGPEGIAVGRGSNFYVGSIPTGAIFHGDLRTGEGDPLVPPQEGRAAIGLWLDDRTNYLYVAGGPTGAGYVYDATTGEDVVSFQFTTQASFVNDVVVTREAAYFTDSFRPFMYRVQLSNDGSPGSTFDEVALTGEFNFVPGAFNANGIDATPNGKHLVIVNSTLGELYLVDPSSGVATLIDLGGTSVTAGDGILLDGKTLYVVRNQLNEIAVVKLSPDLLSGGVVDTITDSDFDVPTTIAEFGHSLYAVNARFGTSPPPDVEYDVVKVSK
jgi:hypothetical protein